MIVKSTFRLRARSWAGLLVAVSLLWATPDTHAKERSTFSAPPLTQFNGRSWGGLVLAQSTAGELKARYNLDDSDFSNASQIRQDRASHLRLDILWRKIKDNRVLDGLIVRFREPEPLGPSLASLHEAYGPPEVLYQPNRLDDWHLALYPEAGLCAFVLTEGTTTSVPMLVFVPPSTFSVLRATLSNVEQPIVERVDPGEDWDRVVEFGLADVTADLKGGLRMRSSERRAIESDLKDATARSTLRYRYGTTGSYEVGISGTQNQDGKGRITVTSTISGQSPYGPISAYSSSLKTWNKPKDSDDRDREDRAYTEALRDALREARSQAESSFASKVRSAGPPTIAQVRQQHWLDLVKRLRLAAERDAK